MKGKLLCLIISMFLLVGCIDYKVSMTIKEDKSVNIAMEMEMDYLEFANTMLNDPTTRALLYENLFGSMCDTNCSMYNEGTQEFDTCRSECLDSIINNDSTLPSEEELKSYLDEYFNSEEFNEEEFFSKEDKEAMESKGYTVNTTVDKENYTYKVSVSQTFENIDDLITTNEDAINLEQIFDGSTDNKFFTKDNNDTYKAKFIVDMSSEEQEIDVDMNDYISFHYEVVLPNGAISNNATSVSSDAKTLTWDIDLSGNTDVEYEFSFVNNDKKEKNNVTASDDTLNLIAYGLIGVGAIGIIVVLVLLFKKKKN